MRLIKRLPQYAERKFSLLCSAAGARAHKAEEDEGGWDYLVELPEQKHIGPADTHPPTTSAYVQVKSKSGNQLSCRIKLSNALRAAQSRQPWFVVFIVLDADGGRTRTYAVHIWSGLMATILKKVREAENANQQLHKRTVTLKFESSDERGDGLIEWMQGCIAAIGERYEETKKDLHKNIGYEESAGLGEVTIEATNTDEIVDGFLGLGSGLKLTKFTYTPSRFGIPDTTPKIEWREVGRLFVTPDPVGECQIRVRSSMGSVALQGKVYSFAPPGRPEEEGRLRFSAKFLDAISTVPSQTIRFNLKCDFDEIVDLRTLSQFCTVRAWVGKERIEMQIWSRGNCILSGQMNSQITDPHDKWFQLAAFLTFLRKVAGSSEQKVKLTLGEVAAVGQQVRLFRSFNEEANFRMEFFPFEETQDKITSLIYYSRAKIGKWTFCVLARRVVASDVTVEAGKRQITSGKPTFVDSYVLENATPEQEQMLQSDYARYLDRLKSEENTLGIGDIIAFYKSTNDSEKEEFLANIPPDQQNP